MLAEDAFDAAVGDEAASPLRSAAAVHDGFGFRHLLKNRKFLL
jgi:hypothetical protein